MELGLWCSLSPSQKFPPKMRVTFKRIILHKENNFRLTLGKCLPPGSLRSWLLTSLCCGVHISTAHCFSHRHTLSLLSNILSLLLFRADPQQSTSSHLFHLHRLLLGRAPRTSYRPICHGEVWWQTSSFTLVRLCLLIQS